MLGVERGKLAFRELTGTSVQVASRSVRILSDNCESQVGANSSVFTVQGATHASSISSDDILETINIPADVRSQIAGSPSQSTDTRTTLIGSMSYILGTQFLARRLSNRLVIDASSQANASELSLEFHKTLKELDIPHKIYLPRYGTRVRVDSWKLSSLLRKLCSRSDSIPTALRLSRPEVMRQFVCGILDANLSRKSDAKGEVRFRTLMTQSELRRFVLHVLRLYGIKPSHSSPHYPSDGLSSVDNYFPTSDLQQMGLRFFRVQSGMKPKGENVTLSYSKVRDVRKFVGKNVTLGVSGSGWALAADLALLSRG